MKKLLSALSIIIMVISLSPLITLADNSWSIVSITFVSRTRSDVYPGSSGASLDITLAYNSTAPAINPSACLSLPSGFTLRSSSCVLPSNYTIGSEITLGSLLEYHYIVDVDKSVQPGVYGFILNITYVQQGVLKTEILNGTIEVKPYPPLSVSVRDAYWTPIGYPGSYPTSLVLELSNDGNTTILHLDAQVSLPAWAFITSNRSSTGALQPGYTTTLTFSNIAIDPSAKPGVYNGTLYVNATLETSDGVVYTSSAQTVFSITVDPAPNIKLQVLDYSFTSNVVMPGLNNTGINIRFRSYTTYTISNIAIYARLQNGYFSNGSNTAFLVVNNPVNYGDVFSITLTGVYIDEEAGFVRLTLSMNAIVDSQGTRFPASLEINLVLPVPTPMLNLTVVNVYWSNGLAYPNSASNSLVVEVYNGMNANIRDASVELILPDPFYPSQTVIQGVSIPSLGIARLEFTGISIKPWAESGSYSFQLVVRGLIVNSDGSSRLINIVLGSRLRIESLSILYSSTSTPEISSYFWGTTTPQHVYPGDSRAPFTLILYNPGPQPISPLFVSITPLNDPGIVVLNNNISYSGVLSPGSTVSLTFYLDLRNATHGVKVFNVYILYGVRAGSYSLFNYTSRIQILLEKWGAGEGLVLVSAGWQNNYPAFPNSSNAVYTVTLANTLPYQVTGIWLELLPPEGLKASRYYSLTYYISGPVNPFGTVTASFVLDIGSINPGIYLGLVKARYSIVTNNAEYTEDKTYTIVLNISNPFDAIGIVSYGWLTGQPYPGEKGALYYVRFVNRDFPSIRGVSVKIRLPEGYSDSFTLAGEAEGFTGSLPSLVSQYAQLLRGGSNILDIVRQIPQAQQFSEGDFIDVFFVINIGRTLFNGSLPAEIEFTDHWGSTYRLDITIPFTIEGAPPLVEISTDRIAIDFMNGTGLVSIMVANKYDSPAYDVYIILIPQSFNAIPLGNVKYLDVLPPKSNVSIAFTIVYNPITLSVSAGVTATSPATVFTVTLIYRDASGYISTLNQTVAFQVKPFVDLVLTPDTTVKYSAGTIVVNGVVLNEGISKARSVVVYCSYGNQTSFEFLGDIDSATQTGFRLELNIQELKYNYVTIKLVYRDDFNNLFEKTFNVPIQIASVPATTLTQSEQSQPIAFYMLVTIIVALFLAGVFYIVYKKARK
ncbi:hypothetical protein ACSU1N_06250 [Thermogladius sp. 4427co]|uniref:hypothetical protein n=1 Tax=Thermogladius sp. 4427co TaxID=3450718 RepID=UPI003F796D69